MTEYSTITRNGILNLKGNSTSNQCAKQGHEVYRYELKVLFSAGTKLNSKGWIIDHQHFDDAVQQTHVNSCEIMANEILDAIEKTLERNALNCVGIKLKIQPSFTVEENSAYFQKYRCHHDKDLMLVLSL